MTHAAPTLLTAGQIRAIVATMRGWLFACAGWLLDTFGVESAVGRAVAATVRRDLDDLSTELKALVLVLAALRLRTIAPLITRPRGNHLPQNAPRGFRVARPACSGRDFMRGTLPRARSLRARITMLLRTLRHLERAVARLVQRVLRGPHGAAFTAVAPPHAALHSRAVAPADTDTS